MSEIQKLVDVLNAVSHIQPKLPTSVQVSVLPATVKLIIDGLIAVVQEILNLVLAFDPAAQNSAVVKVLQDILASLKALGL